MRAHQDIRKQVMIVDDHAVVRRGLSMLINEADDLQVCGEADDERSAVERVADLRPDVAVIDWSLGNREAADLIQDLRVSCPEMPILVLSIHDEIFYAEKALRIGASGYVMKQEATERIITAIRRLAEGHSYLTERAAASLPEAMRIGLRREMEAPSLPHVNGHAIRSARLTRQMEISSVSVIIPVYNSETTIERLGQALIDQLGHTFRLQLILVDDGSTDLSAAACRRLHAQFPTIVDYVELSRNFGEHNAVMAGLNCANGDFCVIMDDDLQNPPEEVCHLIEEVRKGYDVVYARYPRKQHTPLRNLASWTHNLVATLTLGKPVDLYLSSFKVLTRFVAREAVRYTGPDPYLDAIILRTTKKIGVVTVRHECRRNGKSGYTFAKLLSLSGNMIVTFSLYPVRAIGLLGTAIALVGTTYGLRNAICYFSPSLTDPDPIQHLDASNWFLRGVTIMVISLVAEYVGRMHMSINRSPQFIVRDLLKHHSTP